ncbi:MAG: hypothetical protein H0X30_08835 [Anaerolineae bacterium]|nr:hypothetical protein [Anaerolineae bacterium]
MFSRIMRNLPLVGNRLPSLSMLRATDQWRHLYPWFQSRRENYLLDHAIPWLVYDAAEYLRANLQKNIRVFEYGSGSSTLFWSKFDAHCTSIEHDGSWVNVLRTRFNPAYDVDLRLVPTDNPPLPLDKDIADPSGYRSDWFGFERQTFKTYVEQIDTFPDGCFDVVLVDGQARPSCIAHSYKKVKSRGMLIVDNADLSQYQPALHEYLAAFNCHSFTGIAPIEGVLSRTNVYIAP